MGRKLNREQRERSSYRKLFINPMVKEHSSVYILLRYTSRHVGFVRKVHTSMLHIGASYLDISKDEKTATTLEYWRLPISSILAKGYDEFSHTALSAILGKVRSATKSAIHIEVYHNRDSKGRLNGRVGITGSGAGIEKKIIRTKERERTYRENLPYLRKEFYAIAQRIRIQANEICAFLELHNSEWRIDESLAQACQTNNNKGSVETAIATRRFNEVKKLITTIKYISSVFDNIPEEFANDVENGLNDMNNRIFALMGKSKNNGQSYVSSDRAIAYTDEEIDNKHIVRDVVNLELPLSNIARAYEYPIQEREIWYRPARRSESPLSAEWNIVSAEWEVI